MSNNCFQVLQDVTGDEFILFMYILQNLPHLQTVTGRQQLLQLVMEQADLDKAFQVIILQNIVTSHCI